MDVSIGPIARRLGAVLTAATLGVAMLAATPSQAGTRASSSSATCSVVQEPKWGPIGNRTTGAGIQSLNFSGVSAASPTHAWAVGAYFIAGTSAPATYRWNGTKWRGVPFGSFEPGTLLHGVLDLGPGNAWAVGVAGVPDGHPLIMHWSGDGWQSIPSPSSASGPGGVTVSIEAMRGISGVRARDVWGIADGYAPSLSQGFQVTEHWDGSSWSVVRVVRSPSGGAIVAVGPHDVWESQYYGALAHYDGVSWQTVSDHVRSFGASSDADVWTQIDDDPPPVYVGDGQSWNPVPIPLGNGHIDAFAPFSPTDTWALVENANLSRTGIGLGPLHWDGVDWQAPDLSAITPAFRNRIFEAITTVPGTDSVWIVGYSGGSPLHPMFLLASC